MKINSKIIVFLIIVCILSCVSAVSANEINDNAVTADNDYQSDIKLNQQIDCESVSQSFSNEETLNAECENSNLLDEEADEDSFTSLVNLINQSETNADLSHDYTFNETIDKKIVDIDEIFIIKGDEEFTLNGNGHVIDGAGCDATFVFDNVKGNIVINDLTFKNFNNKVISTKGKITFNNVNFTGCNREDGEVILVMYTNASFNGCNFHSNTVEKIISGSHSDITVNNSQFQSDVSDECAISINRGQLTVHNSNFKGFTYKNGAFVYFKGVSFELVNSTFINAVSNHSGGAILAKYIPFDEQADSFIPKDGFIIRDCVFENVSCLNDGGAVFIDLDSASNRVLKTMNIINSNFTNCSARFGGAIIILGGKLNVVDSKFKNNTAGFEGGAIYSSWTNVNITRSFFTENNAQMNAGVLYFDKGQLTINESDFTNNKAFNNSVNAVYAHDAVLALQNSTFDNGGIGFYADFADVQVYSDVKLNNDTFKLDNHDYVISVETPGVKFNFFEDDSEIDTLPERWDARDYNWTTPGKIQGDNNDCWAFATVATIETALLKSTGIAYNLSQNYVQTMQLKYHQAGDIRNSMTGFSYSGLGYALSWLGVLPIDGPYDDRVVILDTGMDVERIHVQDAMLIYTGMDDTIEQLKWAIMKYGAVTVQAYVVGNSSEIPTEGDDIALMNHGTHFISLIGWEDRDDEYGGVWFTKDSMSGFNEIAYTIFSDIDIYAIVPQMAAVAYIFENDIDYHVNYQTDLTGLTGFDGNYTSYSNEFTSKYDEYIGAVGTYFNESDIEYSFDILVNDEIVHSQSGVSEFAGFRTIVLDKYVPVKAGDVFKVVFKSNCVPYQAWSRVHYMTGKSLVSKNGSEWVDFAGLNKTVCLKVYTIEKNDDSFTALRDVINQSGSQINLTHDYTFKKGYDDHLLVDLDGSICINIDKDLLVINGNNQVIDGAGAGVVFNLRNSDGNITINDLTFRNFSTNILSCAGRVTLNNVNFTDCNLTDDEIIAIDGGNATLNGCNFYAIYVNKIISEANSELVICNSRFIGNDFIVNAIDGSRGSIIIHNSTFENFTCMTSAIIDLRGHRFELVNSSFINSATMFSGGAILAKYFPVGYDEGNCTPSGPFIIMDCTFANLTAGNDGGAIHIDLDSASNRIKKEMYIINTNFTDCGSRFGGAISVMGGNLSIVDSNFINNTASFEGGALYTTWSNVNITRSRFINNTGVRNAGALYFDKGRLNITSSAFIRNKLIYVSNRTANAIYAHDVIAVIDNSSFDNGGVGVYADFADNSKLINVTKNNDTFLMDNHDYIVSIETPGIRLNLNGNQMVVDTLPSKFDARDYGWTTPGKVQGSNDDCWAFATIASIETALKKSTGVEYNLSQNYVQEMQMKYFWAGDLRISWTGFSYSGLGYALSWLGVMPMDSPYDDRGLLLDTNLDDERIHVQDAMIIYTGQDDTVENIKRAIMKYGAVTVQLYARGSGEGITTEGDDIAIAEHGTHFVSLIGWDDNFSDFGDNETQFMWFTKDSLSEFSMTDTLNFPDIDEYAIIPQRVAIAYIFENDINYHVNYQTDLTGLAGFDGNYTSYSNEFTSKYDELIGAVGTYFNESGIDYSFDVYVNGEKVHTQSGVSEFAGFRTIVINKYIPVKTGDVFRVVFKSNSVPFQAWSRVHYMSGTSLASADGNTWVDFAPLNKTVCLKVYTLADDVKITGNKDVSVDYDGGSYFAVKVTTADGKAVFAGEDVTFKINGKTVNVKTDSNGIAKFMIGELPGKYVVTTTYRGVDYKNTVTVKHVVTASKSSVKNTDKKLVLKATLKINGKAVKGKTVKFTFKGKTYTAKTNAKGVASVTVKKAVVKKLTGKSYTFKVSYLKDTVKGTVTVKQVLKAYKASVKKSSKKLKLKATLKINGKAAKKKTIKFKFKGKTYKAKTNKKGIAKLTIKKKVIKKLKKGKTYKVKVSYGKAYVMTTVKVKR